MRIWVPRDESPSNVRSIALHRSTTRSDSLAAKNVASGKTTIDRDQVLPIVCFEKIQQFLLTELLLSFYFWKRLRFDPVSRVPA